MENVLLIVAYVAFVLAGCSLVASIVIFVKADVPDAIRFLQHKPMKNQATGKTAAKKRAEKKQAGRAQISGKGASKGLAKRPTRSTEEVVEKASVVPAPPEQKRSIKAKSTTGTTVMEDEGPVDVEQSSAPSRLAQSGEDAALHGEWAIPPCHSERESDGPWLKGSLPSEEDTERPTSVLAEETERPTSVLQGEDTERPTSVLAEDSEGSERPTSVLEEGTEDTERPTSVLEEATEHPTSILDDGSVPDSSIVSHRSSTDDLGTTFKFQITKKVLSVNTDERI